MYQACEQGTDSCLGCLFSAVRRFQVRQPISHKMGNLEKYQSAAGADLKTPRGSSSCGAPSHLRRVRRTRVGQHCQTINLLVSLRTGGDTRHTRKVFMMTVFGSTLTHREDEEEWVTYRLRQRGKHPFCHTYSPKVPSSDSHSTSRSLHSASQ